MSKQKNNSQKGKFVEVRREYPEANITKFTNDLAVQFDDENFILSFFEILPPMLLGSDEKELQNQIEKIEYVNAHCISRLVVTPKKLKSFIDALVNNYEKYQEQILDERIK
jgi:hypothetical protein